MTFLNINRFCCCLSLHTSGIIIGVLGTLFSLLTLFVCVFYLTDNIYMYFEFLGEITYVIASILLIIGTKKKSHLMLLPWLIIHLMAVIAPLLMIIFPIILFFGFPESRIEQITVVTVLFTILSIVCYLWIAAYSLYSEIKISNEKSAHQEMEEKIDCLPPPYDAVNFNI